jgi:cholera toxin transcriptional activator
MAQPPNQSRGRTFRFGLFEADDHTGELRREGKSQPRLRDQAFRILIVLLERPQELVTRDELRERLWAADTFVDFDHGLNTAINQLRNALGDEAANPRFIQTLPRRGYRFIAPAVVVGEITRLPAEVPVPTQPTEPAPRESSAGIQTSDMRALPVISNSLMRTLFALLQVMYLIFYVIALARLSQVSEILGAAGAAAQYLLILLIVTAAAGIPTRLYLLTASAFNYRGLNHRFRALFPFLLPLDLLWALAPFLLIEQIGMGAALATTAALLYSPFAQRTLLMMGFRKEAQARPPASVSS